MQLHHVTNQWQLFSNTKVPVSPQDQPVSWVLLPEAASHHIDKTSSISLAAVFSKWSTTSFGSGLKIAYLGPCTVNASFYNRQKCDTIINIKKWSTRSREISRNTDSECWYYAYKIFLRRLGYKIIVLLTLILLNVKILCTIYNQGWLLWINISSEFTEQSKYSLDKVSASKTEELLYKQLKIWHLSVRRIKKTEKQFKMLSQLCNPCLSPYHFWTDTLIYHHPEIITHTFNMRDHTSGSTFLFNSLFTRLGVCN